MNPKNSQSKGRHEQEEKKEGKEYYRRERYAGSFCHRIPLSREVKEEDIEANLDDGILEIKIKGAGERKAVSEKRKIPIESS